MFTILVIEVDGFKYHDENEAYLRLKTNGSDEEKRIREKLLS